MPTDSPREKRQLVIPGVLLWVSILFPRAQEVKTVTGFSFHGYATANYQKFDWQADFQRRAQVDLERLALEPSWRVNDWLRFDAEIEFEHGGTGSSMELDKLEEFGEFESEIEKGGEVVLEEVSATFELHPGFNVRLGHFILPLGFAYRLDEPTDYFTVQRSATESNLMPVLWDETGAAIFGGLSFIQYEVALVNGLDATGFGSATWIARGHQGRFETVNAENLACAGRLDVRPLNGLTLGVAGYFGNSADNRPKPDLKVPARVAITEVHGEFSLGPYIARGLFLYGILENSGLVSQANRNLSNNLQVERTPVARSARGYFLEAGADALELWRSGFGLYPQRHPGRQGIELYGRYDVYDTMREMDEGFFNNPRWDRETWSGGVNYKPHPRVALKSQYAHRILGTATENVEDTYSLGMGLLF